MKGFFHLVLFIAVGISLASAQQSFTDSDLEKYKKKSDISSGTSRGNGSEPSRDLKANPGYIKNINRYRSSTDRETSRQFEEDKYDWCRRAEAARSRIVQAEKDAASAEDRYYSIHNKFLRDKTTVKYGDVEAARSEVENAKNNIEEAKKALDALGSEAHRRDIPPGWLNCNFN